MRKTVLIAFADAALEAAAVRGAAEAFGASVYYYPIGRPSDFLAVLAGHTGFPPADVTVLCMHGEGGAFLMPVLGEDVYEPGEPRGPVGPDLIRKALRLEKTVFLSTACTTGREETAAAFRECGNVYAAPSGYAEGSAALMFAVRFLYEVLAKGTDPRRAVKVAASADGETGMFADGEAPV